MSWDGPIGFHHTSPEHHWQGLRGAPGWHPWPPHRSVPWDAAFRRGRLVALLFLGAPPPVAAEAA
jgi:hypothetical protein